jgi:hypothetical protein
MLISWRFLVPEKYPLFLQKSSIFLVSKSKSLALFFSGNSDVFHGAETRLQSAAYFHPVRTLRREKKAEVCQQLTLLLPWCTGNQ